MRTFIFALATIVSALCVIDQAGAADRLPAFDIARNCNAETAGVAIGTGVESCTKDETDARNELAKRWSQFGVSEKKFCVGESSTGGEQSYVELLTCLEMSTSQFSSRQQRPTLALGRVGTLEDVASIGRYLAVEAHMFMTGQHFVDDGFQWSC